MTVAPPTAWFAAPSDPSDRYPLAEVIYRSRRTGELLEVQHDLASLRAVAADDWRRTFRLRIGASGPLGSGVWGKHEWVNPTQRLEHVITFGEGHSPLLPVRRFGRAIGVEDVWVKQCGTTHTGSFKDLGMTVLVSQVNQMRADGVPIRAVACASTGDTSAALAAYCAAADLPAIVFLPRGKISVPQLIQPLANGAVVLALDTDFDGCMKIVQAVTEDGSIYLANSMNSLRIEGQKTVGIEVVQQLDWQPPDWFVIPGGNLGNVSALAKGLEMMLELGLIDRRPRLAVAQAAQANPLYQAYRRGFDRLEPMTAGDTLASAIRIGQPVSYDRAVRALQAFDGVVEQAGEAELANAASLADQGGLFCDPHTGVALACLRKLVAAGTIGPGERVVVISTAHGLKFPDWKVQYHEGRLAGVEALHANPPLEVDADEDAVRRVLERWLG